MSRYPVVLALLAAVLFGAATPASKRLLSDLTSLQLAGILYLGAAVGVAPFALGRSRRSGPPARRSDRLRLSGAILFGGIIGPVLLLTGLRLAAAGSVSLWLSLELPATAVLGVWLFREDLGRWGWSGVALALLAALVLSIGMGAAGFVPGALVLLACICWGLDNQLIALVDGIPPTRSTFWKAIVGGAVNLGLGSAFAPLSAGAMHVGTALAVGMVCFGASIALLIGAAQGVGATRAQVVFSSAPLFGLAFSVTLLREPLLPQHVVAVALFACAAACLLAERHSHVHRHEAMAHEHSHRHDDAHHDHVHPGLPAETRHTHWHEHDPVSHEHPHWPDLHHRHGGGPEG